MMKKLDIAKERLFSRANQYGLSIINDPEKINVIVTEAKTMSLKEMLEGNGSYEISYSVIRKLKNNFGLKFGKKEKSGRRSINIEKVYKHSHPDAIKAFESGEIDEENFRRRAHTKKIRDKMSSSEKKHLDKKTYNSLTNRQLDLKKERQKKYLKNLTDSQLEKKKDYDIMYAEKRWQKTLKDPNLLEKKRALDREYRRKKNKK